MKIRLTRDLPVDPIHKMTSGRVLEVLEGPGQLPRGSVRYWVQGDIERVGVMSHEAEWVPDDTAVTDGN
jgi:hypothetical protein